MIRSSPVMVVGGVGAEPVRRARNRCVSWRVGNGDSAECKALERRPVAEAEGSAPREDSKFAFRVGQQRFLVEQRAYAVGAHLGGGMQPAESADAGKAPGQGGGKRLMNSRGSSLREVNLRVLLSR